MNALSHTHAIQRAGSKRLKCQVVTGERHDFGTVYRVHQLVLEGALGCANRLSLELLPVSQSRFFRGEPLRLSRRLQLLRGLEPEQIETIFPRG